MPNILLFIVGLVLLSFGADLFVRGASRAAVALRISPLIVGLTIVAFGTSAPELAVSMQAAVSGDASVAIGNVVGSNIINILLILGLSAVITPLAVDSKLIRNELPLMVAVSGAFWLMAFNGLITHVEGIILIAGLLGYAVWTIRRSKSESELIAKEYAEAVHDERIQAASRDAAFWAKNMFIIVGGLAILILGSNLLLDSAVAIAGSLGISPNIIGLTLVAGGTSLPELATSIVAAIRGQRDIAVGNVVGSNLFNILGVVGLTSVVAGYPLDASGFVSRDIPVMLFVAIACVPIAFTGRRIGRGEGVLFLVAYAAYTIYLATSA